MLKTLPSGAGEPGKNSAEVRLRAVQELGQPGAPPPSGGGVHVLPIIGQIEGHVLLPVKNKTTKYEHVIPQLVAVEQNPSVKGLLVILNTVGGDIEAGLAIAEMIRTLSKPTVSLVLGGGHSIGAPIAVAARRSFIASTATMTVHPIRLTGMVIGVPQTYEYLEKMQERVIGFVVQNSRIPEETLRELMFRTGELMRDVGTVLVGAEAVRAGLIDQVGGLHDAYRALQEMMAAPDVRAFQPEGAGLPVSPAAPTVSPSAVPPHGTPSWLPNVPPGGPLPNGPMHFVPRGSMS